MHRHTTSGTQEVINNKSIGWEGQCRVEAGSVGWRRGSVGALEGGGGCDQNVSYKCFPKQIANSSDIVYCKHYHFHC